MNKTYFKPITVWQTVVSADDTAGTVDIIAYPNASADDPTDDVVINSVRIDRAGVDVTEDAVVTYDKEAGAFTVTDGGVTYALTADDVIAITFAFVK